MNASGTPFNDPFTQWPDQREPGLPFYAAPPLNSNYYFYWVYYLFYTNHTRYLGELMGVEGISIFVVFYNLQSASFNSTFMTWAAGINASAPMQYQYGVTEAYSSKSFAIYRSNYLAPEAAYFSARTLVAGSVATLDTMAYAGWNLTTEALSVSGDAPVPGSSDSLSGIGSIVLGDQQGLYDLAFQAAGAYCVDPLNYVDTSLAASGAWTTSQRPFSTTVGLDQPLPYAYGLQGASMTIPIPGSGPPGALLWVKLLRTPTTGTVQFTFDSHSVVNITSQVWSSLGTDYDGFAWTSMSFPSLGSGGELSVSSVLGRAGIAEICLASPAQLARGESTLLSQAQAKSIGVSLVEPAYAIADTSGGVARKVAPYPQNFSDVPEGKYLLLTPTQTTPASIEVQVPSNGQTGTVFVLVGSLSVGPLTVVAAGQTTNLTPFVRTSTLLDSSTWRWYPASVPEVYGWATVSITAPKNGSAKLYVGAVAYVPDQELTPAGLFEVERILAGRNLSDAAGGPHVVATSSSSLATIPVQNGSVSSQGIPVKPTVSGFALQGGSCVAGSVLVRTSYFPSFEPGGSATSVYPTLGSMNLVIEKGIGCVAGISSKTWNYLLIGGAISLGTVALLTLLPVYPRALRSTQSIIRRLRRTREPNVVPRSPASAAGAVSTAASVAASDSEVVARLSQMVRTLAEEARSLPPNDEVRQQAVASLREVVRLLAAHRLKEAAEHLAVVGQLLALAHSVA